MAPGPPAGPGHVQKPPQGRHLPRQVLLLSWDQDVRSPACVRPVPGESEARERQVSILLTGQGRGSWPGLGVMAKVDPLPTPEGGCHLWTWVYAVSRVLTAQTGAEFWQPHVEIAAIG